MVDTLPTCPTCDGAGEVTGFPHGDDGSHTQGVEYTCPDCEGTGEVPDSGA